MRRATDLACCRFSQAAEATAIPGRSGAAAGMAVQRKGGSGGTAGSGGSAGTGGNAGSSTCTPACEQERTCCGGVCANTANDRRIAQLRRLMRRGSVL
jgi:hypothetical protein